MDQIVSQQLKLLCLPYMEKNWDTLLADATKAKPSYQRFLTDAIAAEYNQRVEQRRISRIKTAKIPDMLVMETFPFSRQPRLNKRMVLGLYDSLNFLTQAQVLLFAGPTGCGKSGLATAFLIHALNNGKRSRFIDFKDLLHQLFQACANNSQQRLLKHFADLDCLLIDEIGYTRLDANQEGLFFDLVKRRHKKHCTIMTSQLGFDEWNGFIENQHICAAILDRITENCTIFNMSKCISLRPKNIAHANQKITEPDNP
jgi:DNA replication protein DnaC